MADDTNASEIGVFQCLVTSAMRMQGQLSWNYQTDRYLRDGLQEALDLASIQDFLKDRPVKTSQDIIIRVANKLSDRAKTAGEVSEYWALNDDEKENNAVMYRFGQSYGGGEARQIKPFYKKGPP